MNCQQIGKFTKKNNSIFCTDCITGSEQNYYKTSCICSKDTYKINKTNLECSNCPNDFICPKDSNIKTISIKKNF